MTRHPSAPAVRRRAPIGLLLTGILMVQAAFVPAVAADERAMPPSGNSTAPVQAAPTAEVAVAETEAGPGAHYAEAMAHVDDRITFTPGGRVDVPFRPRAGDTALVDGRRPRALPGGRATGAQMAAAAQGTRWTPLGDRTAGPPSPSPTSAVPTPEPAAPTKPDSAPTSPPPSPAPAVAPSADPSPPVDGPAFDEAEVVPAVAAVAVQSRTGATADPAAGSLSRQVFGFLPYWELTDSSTVLDYRVLSTIAYFSVGVDKAGNLMKKNSDGTTTTGWGGWTSSRLTNVINSAHAEGTRVVLTLTSFAWTTSQAANQAALLGSASARTNVARQAAAAVRDRGADGINLDFEPIASGYADEFTALVREMRAELNAIAPGYQLTFDTTGYIGNYPIEAATAPGGADAIFIMGYDFKTAGSNPVGSIDPLIGPYYDITQALDAYTARVPASKLILGVPYYGRAWSTDSDKAHAKNVSGTKYGSSATVIYASIQDLITRHGRRWDSVEQSPYLAYQRETCTTTYGCVTGWRQLWYDDAASLKQKYDLVNRYGLAGAGIWALGYDNTRPELYAALAEKFTGGASLPPPPAAAPKAGIVVLPWRQRDAGFLVRWSGSSDAGVASWDVQVSIDGGPYQAWLTRTTRTSEVWLAESGHGYAFRVRATDTNGTAGAWDVTSTWKAAPPLAVGAFGGVKVTGLSMRAAPTTSATKVGELIAGQIVSVIGGPVSADGYTWWQVTGPIREWQPITAVSTFWVAQGPSSEPFLVASRAPNSTIVDAVIRDLEVGDASGTVALGSIGARTFSPNGDGRRDRLTMRWTNTLAFDALTLKVYRSDGALLGSFALDDTALGGQEHTWDGMIGGTRVADGTYMLALSGIAAGATFSAPSSQPVTPWQIASYGVIVDTVGPVISGATIGRAAFSPNGDGSGDTVAASVTAAGTVGWGATVAVVDGPGAGTIIRSASATGIASWTWDGRTTAGQMVADGRYRLSMWIADVAGNRSQRAWTVAVDRRAPVVSAGSSPAVFSPNADGIGDTALLRWGADEPASGALRVLKGTTVLKTWAVGTTGTVTWNGRDRTAVPAPDGPYTVRVDVLDTAGNRTIREAKVVVDRTVHGLSWSPALYFPHDRDGLATRSTVSFSLSRTATTSLRILTQDNRYVRTAWLNRSLPAGTARFAWNGLDGKGGLVPRGWYRAVLTVTTPHGTTTQTRLVLVDAFTLTPSATTLAAGQTLAVTLRTAERLATMPRVTFTQLGATPVTRTATSLGGDRYRVTFTVAAGHAGSARIFVTARDASGGTNAQTSFVTVR